jgi:hypothetical protein
MSCCDDRGRPAILRLEAIQYFTDAVQCFEIHVRSSVALETTDLAGNTEVGGGLSTRRTRMH